MSSLIQLQEGAAASAVPIGRLRSKDRRSSNDLQSRTERVSLSLARLASLCTEPAVMYDQLKTEIKILDRIHPPTADELKLLFKAKMAARIVGYALLAVVLSPIGIVLRAIANRLRPKPFYQTKCQPKPADSIPRLCCQRPSRFRLGSWNIAGIRGDSAYSYAGVRPIEDGRLPKVLAEIQSWKADVVTLSEVFDVRTAERLQAGLFEQGFQSFVFGVGTPWLGSIGTTSGLFVAARQGFSLRDVRFAQYEGVETVGRAQWTAKGVLSFDVVNRFSERAVHMVTTHSQFSERPEWPTCEEIGARKQQWSCIMREVDEWRSTHTDEGAPIVVTGDFNQDPRPGGTASEPFEHLRTESRPSGVWIANRQGVIAPGAAIPRRFEGRSDDLPQDASPSWGGDTWCSKVPDGPKTPSAPRQLDHTWIYRGTGNIVSYYRDVGFDGTRWNPETTSDHCPDLTDVYCCVESP
ncbi:MAG: endonuclease/exonuclease/phosphatase family protein [Chlamydiia bacterium]